MLGVGGLMGIAVATSCMLGAFVNGGQGACIDYGPVQGVGPALALKGLIDPPGDYRGALPVNAMTRVTDITDGTSCTLLVAEDAVRPQRWQVGQMVPGAFSFGAVGMLILWASAWSRALVRKTTIAGAPWPMTPTCVNPYLRMTPSVPGSEWASGGAAPGPSSDLTSLPDFGVSCEPSLNHLIRSHQHRLLQIAWLGASQDLVDINDGAPIRVDNVRPVGGV